MFKQKQGTVSVGVCMGGSSSTRGGDMMEVAAAFSQSSDESTEVISDDGR